MYSVYVIQNREGMLYKGFTSDLEKRLHQHNSNDGFRSFTAGKDPWIMVYKEDCKTETEARKRERFLKSGTGRRFLKEYVGRLSASADG